MVPFQQFQLKTIPLEDHNNFLAQINLNPKSDTIFINIPDAIIEIKEFFNNCRDQVALEIQICNQGAEPLPTNVPVALLLGKPHTSIDKRFSHFHSN